MQQYHICASIIYTHEMDGHDSEEGYWATFVSDNIDNIIQKASLMYTKMINNSTERGYSKPQMIIGLIKNIDSIRKEVHVQQIYQEEKPCVSSDQLNYKNEILVIAGWIMTHYIEYCDEMNLTKLVQYEEGDEDLLGVI